MANQPIGDPAATVWRLYREQQLKDLRARFPWLDYDEPVSGADVVDTLIQWYEDLKQQTR